MKGILEKYSSYNLWANRKFVSFLEKADTEVLDTVIPSSFDTIKKTLVHIWDAEYIWCKRLKGIYVESWPGDAFTGSNDELFKAFISQSEELRDYVKQSPEQMLSNNFSYKTLDGREFTNSVYDTLIHVFNHSTYHRGQIVTILRNTGFTRLDSTDYITYIREIQS